VSTDIPVDQPEGPEVRKPRKIFLLVGVVVAAALGVGLFTSLGTSKNSGPPRTGGPVPSFSAPRLNGSASVQVPLDGGSGGHPAVLLFFGNWCEVCHAELPALAAAVRHQDSRGGALAGVRVIGIDSEDTTGNAKGFIRSSGVTFPVAYDPNDDITNGDFYFQGDPYAVFVNGDGAINAIIAGPMSAARFTAAEMKLIPTGK
jgi:peroxiredoxin